MEAVTIRADSFPVERLPAPLRERAEAVLLHLLDSEALFTFVGGLKPISVLPGPVSPGERDESETLRRILPAMRCGDIRAGLLSAAGPPRRAEIAVYSLSAFARAVQVRAPHFARMGILPSSGPLDALKILDKAAPAERNRSLGYLYGYPCYAVDYFCEKRRRERPSYFEVPTFSGNFAYPAPGGQPPRLEDVSLREAAHTILAEYRRRRSRFVGAGGKGSAELLRDWFDDGRGRCSPENARYG